MSINQLILATLSGLNVPVVFQHYTGKADTYIAFREYDQRGARHGDDEELKTRHFIQVDIFSKGNYENLVLEVKRRLKEKGFIRTSEADFYETDTKLYHKGIRFTYVQ